tara:strand:- start:15490 stop:16470 length:981 start_codon:yes stop_codon:yes gene_type:complete
MKKTSLKLLCTLGAFTLGAASASAVDMLAPLEGPIDGINLDFTQDVSHIFANDLKDVSFTSGSNTEDDIGVTRAKTTLTHRSELYAATFDVEGYYEFSRYQYDDKSTALPAGTSDKLFDNAHRVGLDLIGRYHFDECFGAYARMIGEMAAVNDGSMGQGGRFMGEIGASFSPIPDFSAYIGVLWTTFISADSRVRPVAGFYWRPIDALDIGVRHSMSDITGHVAWDVWVDGLLVLDFSVGYNLRQYRASDDLRNSLGALYDKPALYHQSVLWTLGATHNFSESFFLRGFVLLTTYDKYWIVNGDKGRGSFKSKTSFGLGVQGGIRL